MIRPLLTKRLDSNWMLQKTNFLRNWRRRNSSSRNILASNSSKTKSIELQRCSTMPSLRNFKERKEKVKSWVIITSLALTLWLHRWSKTSSTSSWLQIWHHSSRWCSKGQRLYGRERQRRQALLTSSSKPFLSVWILSALRIQHGLLLRALQAAKMWIRWRLLRSRLADGLKMTVILLVWDWRTLLAKPLIFLVSKGTLGNHSH